MLLRRAALACAILLCLAGARQRPVTPAAEAIPIDVFSAAQPNQVQSIHLSLDLTVDFDAHQIRGSVTHRIVNLASAGTFVLDTRDLDIDDVTVDGRPAAWSPGNSTANGTPLVIDIGPASTLVRIDYRTRPLAAALRWLTAEQTVGRVMPAMWSSSEPDKTRTWIPLQDTPAVRVSYDAVIRVRPGMLALMSASNNPTEANDSGVYRFEMIHPIPAYLIALAAGRLQFRALDERVGIYSEPELLDDAVWEMQRTPEMLRAAERILGPYPFERYDLLFPPAFGGGMENPNLNFISPTLVTGDHPAIVVPNGVIAHEMSHSWAGDLVTCATWSDTWLNEGFATYYEKRILEDVAGWERAEFGYSTDLDALQQYLSTPNLAARLTVLHRQFTGNERPGNNFAIISYQKGEMFLKMLEDKLGRTEFDDFIRTYLRRRSGDWVDDHTFVRLLETTALYADPQVESFLQIDKWLYGSDLPSNRTAPSRSALYDRVNRQADAFRNGRSAASLDRSGWTTIETGLFFQLITDVISAHMADLDATFHLTQLHTPSLHWQMAMARTRWAPGLPSFEQYLLRGTSASAPVWFQLAQTPDGRAYAIPIYARARPYYDPNTQAYIDAVLHFSATGAQWSSLRKSCCARRRSVEFRRASDRLSLLDADRGRVGTLRRGAAAAVYRASDRRQQ